MSLLLFQLDVSVKKSNQFIDVQSLIWILGTLDNLSFLDQTSPICRSQTPWVFLRAWLEICYTPNWIVLKQTHADTKHKGTPNLKAFIWLNHIKPIKPHQKTEVLFLLVDSESGASPSRLYNQWVDKSLDDRWYGCRNLPPRNRNRLANLLSHHGLPSIGNLRFFETMQHISQFHIVVDMLCIPLYPQRHTTKSAVKSHSFGLKPNY